MKSASATWLYSRPRRNHRFSGVAPLQATQHDPRSGFSGFWSLIFYLRNTIADEVARYVRLASPAVASSQIVLAACPAVARFSAPLGGVTVSERCQQKFSRSLRVSRRVENHSLLIN